MAIEMNLTGYQPNTALGVNLNRQKYGPLDFGTLFLNQVDFEYYISEAYTRGSFENKLDEVSAAVKAKHPYPYVGQIISVVTGDEVEVYKLTNEQGGYERVGTVTLGDGVSIVKNADDTLSIVGYSDAEVGAIPKKTAGGIVWEVPSTDTVDGLQTAIGKSDDVANADGSIYARIAKNKADIAVLNGGSTEEGSVAYQIAQIIDGADASFDTLKEIAEWIANHRDGDAATMAANIATLMGQLEGIATDKGSVKALIDAVSTYVGTLPEDATETTVVAHLTSLINAVAGAKVDTTVFEEHTGDTDVHIQEGERTSWTSAKTIADKLDGDVNTEGSVKKQLATVRGELEASINNKVAKEDGKGLSTNDYTTDEKEKLAGVAEGAQVNVIEVVKVNGVELGVGNDKEVDITVPTGALAGKDKVTKDDLGEALQLELDDKLAKVTTAGTTERVYGVSVDGKTQKMMAATNVPTASMEGTNVVIYNPTGTLTTLTPTDNNDAANKKYVDDVAAAAEAAQEALDEYIESNDAVIEGIKNGETVNDFAAAEAAIGAAAGAAEAAQGTADDAAAAAEAAQKTIDDYKTANDGVIAGIKTGDTINDFGAAEDAIDAAAAAAEAAQGTIDDYKTANDAVIEGIKNGETVNDFAAAEAAIASASGAASAAQGAADAAQGTIDAYIESNDAVIEGINGDIEEVSGVASGNTEAIEGLESSKLAKVTTTGTTERVYSVSADGKTQSVLSVTNAPAASMEGTNVVAYNAAGTLTTLTPTNNTDAANKKYVDDAASALTTAVEANDAEILALQGLVGEGFERIGDSTIQALFA